MKTIFVKRTMFENNLHAKLIKMKFRTEQFIDFSLPWIEFSRRKEKNERGETAK